MATHISRVSINIIPIYLPFLMLLSVTNAADMVNITVDDGGPDPLTTQFISYQPVGRWNNGSSCSDCNARLDKTRAYQSTWHDTTFDPGLGQVLYAEFNFTGVAVYVYCILSNSKQFPSGSSDMAFYVDGELKGTFVRDADGSPGYIYDFPVFVVQSLPDGEHKLLIQNGHKGGKRVLMLLDRIIYTQHQKAEVNTTPAPQPIGDGKEQGNQGTHDEVGQDGEDMTKLGAILGGTLGGLGFLLLIGFGWLFWRRRNRNNQNAWQQWPSGVAVNSVHPVDPPVYSEISGERPVERFVGRSFMNGTLTPFMGEAPITGMWPPSRKELAGDHLPQLSSTSS